MNSWWFRILLAALCLTALSIFGYGWSLQMGLALWVLWVITFAWREFP